MHREINGELVTYRFHSFPAERLCHAVFTRLGGTSRPPFATLNVGNSVGDEPAAAGENHVRAYRYLGIPPERVATAQQVHGNHVIVVTEKDGGRASPKTDGLVTQCPRLALMLRFADCQPILLYDPVRHALGLVHVGWRGLAQGMVHRAIEAMRTNFGTQPRDLIAGLGPAIGPCCYEVGDDVAAAMGYALPNWRRVMRRDGDRWRLDLSAANADQLAGAGVACIEQAGICTRCHNDEFFSHRAENGLTGRFAVVAYLHGRPAEGSDEAPETGSFAAGPDSGMPDTIHPAGFPPFGDPSAAPPDAEKGPQAPA